MLREGDVLLLNMLDQCSQGALVSLCMRSEGDVLLLNMLDQCIQGALVKLMHA